MTKTMPKPELREEHKPRDLTHAEFLAEGRVRFGEDGRTWLFVCPMCGEKANALDFPRAAREGIGQECIGRHDPTRGCHYAAYGLFPAPWAVAMPGGHTVRMFALAPAAPWTPQSAEQTEPGTGGPESRERPPQPPTVPATAPPMPTPTAEYLTGPQDDTPKEN